MTSNQPRDARTPWHGNIFSRDSGSMFIHVRRESGLAHRNLVLRPWQVQILRILASRWILATLALGAISWGYFAVQAARVPLLTRRISQLEQDARRLDTLQHTLGELQSRYEQVQRMMSASGSRASVNPAAGAKGTAPANPPEAKKDSAERKNPDAGR